MVAHEEKALSTIPLVATGVKIGSEADRSSCSSSNNTFKTRLLLNFLFYFCQHNFINTQKLQKSIFSWSLSL